MNNMVNQIHALEEVPMTEHTRFLPDIFNSFEDGVYIVGQQHDIEYVNPVIEREFGKVDGRKCHEYFHRRMDACPWCGSKEAFAGNPVKWEWCSLENGRHYEFLAIPISSASGISKLEIRRDISEQKRLQQQLARAQEHSSELKKREEVISFEMREFREIVESNTDTFYAVNSEGKLIKWNSALERLTGLPPHELTLKPVAEFFHEGDRPLVSQKIREVFEKGFSDVEARFIRGDGTVVPYLCNGYVLKDAHGTVTGLAGTGRDISERKRMEEALRQSEARYRELLENASDYIYTNDLNGFFTSVNRSLCERSGYRANELTGAPISKLVSPENIEKARKMTEAKIKEGRLHTRYEIDIIAKNGEIIPIEVNSRLIMENGKPAGVQGIGRDIGERKRAEMKLKAAKDAAEAALLLKDKFISLISHDLRSPLATIMLLQKVAIGSHKNPQCDECRTTLEKSVHICETMLEMTDHLLELARLQGGNIRLNRKICNIKDICDTVIDDLSHLAAKKEISLKNEIPPGTKLYVDRILFRRVIHNLVMNAVKFSGNGGKVTVLLSSGTNNHVAVKDTGAGIDENLLPNLFKHEIKTTTTGTAGEPGTGFGLPMSMDIVRAHGGTIRATSQKREGSTFFVEVPDMKPLVLVADDHEMTQFVIRKYLENEGAEVWTVKNGAEALEIIQIREPILIIADIGMPVMNGFTLLQNLKNGAKHSHIPVLIITGIHGGDIEMRQKAFEFGADDFITKPLSEPDFIPRINRFIAG